MRIKWNKYIVTVHTRNLVATVAAIMVGGWWVVLNFWWCKLLKMSSLFERKSHLVPIFTYFLTGFLISFFFFFFFSFLFTELHHTKTTSWKHSYRFITIKKYLTWRCITEWFTRGVFTDLCCNRVGFVVFFWVEIRAKVENLKTKKKSEKRTK